MEDQIVDIEDDIEIKAVDSTGAHVTVDQRIKTVVADVDKIEADIGFSEDPGHTSVDNRIIAITTDITAIQSDIGYDSTNTQAPYTGLNNRLVFCLWFHKNLHSHNISLILRVNDLGAKITTIETDINIADAATAGTVDARIKTLVTNVTNIETDIGMFGKPVVDGVEGAHVSVATRYVTIN